MKVLLFLFVYLFFYCIYYRLYYLCPEYNWKRTWSSWTNSSNLFRKWHYQSSSCSEQWTQKYRSQSLWIVWWPGRESHMVIYCCCIFHACFSGGQWQNIVKKQHGNLKKKEKKLLFRQYPVLWKLWSSNKVKIISNSILFIFFLL